MAKMYELIHLANFINSSTDESSDFVLVTIFKTEGSSYRKKGTQMLIRKDMEYVGALSGGCVEKEVLRLASKVFFTKSILSTTYDGTKTLGCKGILFLLLEYLPRLKAKALSVNILAAAQNRTSIELSIIGNAAKKKISTFYDQKHLAYFEAYQKLNSDHFIEPLCTIMPQHQIIIYGSNHDVIPIASLAESLGCLVKIILDVAFPSETKLKAFNCSSASIHDFIKRSLVDSNTSIILMTHSLNKDKNALEAFLKTEASYISILGPKSRKDQIVAEIKLQQNALDKHLITKLNTVKGPAGLYIHAQTPEEIALSILAEITLEHNKRS